MRKRVFSLVILFVLATLPLQAASSLAVGPRYYGKIDTKGLEILLRARVPVVLLDARKARFDDGKRIAGAHLVPPTASKAELERVIPSKDTLIITYCSHMRCPLSHELAESLHEKGWTNVIVYPYGLKGWETAGNEFSQSGR